MESRRYPSRPHCSGRRSDLSITIRAVSVKLGLQRLLIFLAVRTMASALRLERHRRALCAVCLDWYTA